MLFCLSFTCLQNFLILVGKFLTRNFNFKDSLLYRTSKDAVTEKYLILLCGILFIGNLFRSILDHQWKLDYCFMTILHSEVRCFMRAIVDLLCLSWTLYDFSHKCLGLNVFYFCKFFPIPVEMAWGRVGMKILEQLPLEKVFLHDYGSIGFYIDVYH